MRGTVHIQMPIGDLVPVRGVSQRCAVVCADHATSFPGAVEIPLVEMSDLSAYRRVASTIDAAVARTRVSIDEACWAAFESATGQGELNAIPDGSLVLVHKGGGYLELGPTIKKWGKLEISKERQSGVGDGHTVFVIEHSLGDMTLPLEVIPRWTAWLRTHYPSLEHL